MMNIFRLAGDMCHVLSILVLLLRLRVSKNAIGVSIKTQELYLIVFIARYLDLFTSFYSLYNTVMKILYISATAYIIYMVKRTEPFKSTFDKAHDSFLHLQFAVAPCIVLAIITNLVQGFDIMDVSFDIRKYLLLLHILYVNICIYKCIFYINICKYVSLCK
jgi:ER lumen protein retaining receptor